MAMAETGPVTPQHKLLFVAPRGLSLTSHAHANNVELLCSIGMPRATNQGVSGLSRLGGQG